MSSEAPDPTPAMTGVRPLASLVVNDFGAYVGKHSERLRVTVKGEVRVEAPLLYLRQVLIRHRGVSLSSDAITACAERGIAIHVVAGNGRASGASLYTNGLTGTVMTRRAQLMAYNDLRAVGVALNIARAKLLNQAALLAYHARSRKGDPGRALRLLADEVRDHDAELDALENRKVDLRSEPPIDQLRGALLSIEGRAAQKYWAGVKLLIPEALGWPGRRGRGSHDAFNSALNYGYAVLERHVEQALVLAGLDPFAGFSHTDRPGRPSLTLDLIEEFRQPVVDRTLLGMIGRREPLGIREDGMLDDDTRRTLADKIIARIEDSAERYGGSKRWALREIIQYQARHLATYLRGERGGYEGFVMK
jgi:CRISP-associated protein Cas1